ncbi:hypothetical protein [Rhodoferax ferrireducens]|uniref:hypothetical protein n=1 Tax=Rhodoferax ferrireducens TaxID=192843 RepID=UPI000E0CCC94|nr:hypothetical protein [Rhodoferax ferrireducens]
MNDESRQSREQPAIEKLGVQNILELANFYIMSNPGQTEKDFIDKFVNRMSVEGSMSGDEILEDLKKIHSSGTPADFKYGPMLISCAHYVRAMKAYELNERELAWSYMADARYWCGVTLAGQGIEAIREKTIQAARKIAPSKGGTARAEIKYKEIKDEAFRLARDSRPLEKGWASRLNAARAIKKQVMAYASQKKQALSEQQAEKTIYDWLKGMPDAKSLFPDRKQAKLKSAA